MGDRGLSRPAEMVAEQRKTVDAVVNRITVTGAVVSPTPSVDVDDVFNDIDSMFQGLAQELDEMLTLQDV